MTTSDDKKIDLVDELNARAAAFDAKFGESTPEGRASAERNRVRVKARLAELRRQLMPDVDLTTPPPIRPEFLAMTRDALLAHLTQILRKYGWHRSDRSPPPFEAKRRRLAPPSRDARRRAGMTASDRHEAARAAPRGRAGSLWSGCARAHSYRVDRAAARCSDRLRALGRCGWSTGACGSSRHDPDLESHHRSCCSSLQHRARARALRASAPHRHSSRARRARASHAKNRRVFKSFTNQFTGKVATWFFYYDPLDRLTEVRHTPDTSASATYSLFQLSWLGDKLVAYWQTDYPSLTTSKRYVTTDETNRPVDMMSWPASGATSRVWTTNPDAWGADTNLLGSSVYQPILFAGQYRDDETIAWQNDGATRHRPGLVLNGFRTYDPWTGSYLQVDPLADRSWSSYVYADCDPVGKSDHNGLLSCATVEWARSVLGG